MKALSSLSKSLILAVTMVGLIIVGRPTEHLQGMSLPVRAAGLCGDAVCVYLPIIHTPCGPGALVFNDDFSDPGSGWYVWDNDGSQAAYLNGEFRQWAKVKDAMVSSAGPSTGVSSGYRLTADVRNVTGTPGHYGLLFGFKGGLSYDFYTYEISPSGGFYIYYHERINPNPHEITLLYSGWSAAIHTGTASNNLAVVHRPSTLYFYANGHLLATLASDRTGADQLQMMTTSTTDANLDTRFDNFQVHEYTCDPES